MIPTKAFNSELEDERSVATKVKSRIKSWEKNINSLKWKFKKIYPTLLVVNTVVSDNTNGIILLIIPLFGHRLKTLPFLSIIAIILFAPVFIGVRSWVRYKFFSRDD